MTEGLIETGTTAWPQSPPPWAAAQGITAEQWQALVNVIITVCAWKGGQGKTTLAAELAYLLHAVLVDFDWDEGGASRALGFDHRKFVRAPLLDALETGKIPAPRRAPFRADLVPSHPDLGVSQPQAKVITEELGRWSADWRQPIVADTHPGGCPTTYGAAAAARLLVVPVMLEVKPLDALEGMLAELRDYRILIVPSIVPNRPAATMIDRLERITSPRPARSGMPEVPGVPVAPPITVHPWLGRRTRRMAVCSGEPSVRSATYVAQVLGVAAEVIKHAAR